MSPVSLEKPDKYCWNSKRSVVDVFHIVLGARQFVPTGRPLVTARRRGAAACTGGPSASIAQTPETTATQKGH